MNQVNLVGNLTKDPDVRYTQGHDPMAVASFSIAIDRHAKGERKTDYPRIKVFGRQAENCERYLAKGSKVGITGRIQTGSYKNRDGQTVYTTDVIANSVEFLSPMSGEDGGDGQSYKQGVKDRESGAQPATDAYGDVTEGFMAVSDETIPF